MKYILRLPKIGYLLLLFVAVISLAGCRGKAVEYVRVEGAMLGTFLQLSAQTEVASSEIYSRMMQIDSAAKRSMSIFDEGSLLSRINRGETDSLDAHIKFNLELARRIHQQSGGMYDVTVKPLVEAYGFAGKNPDWKVNVDSLLTFVGFDKVVVQDNRLVKSDPRVQLDFNSIAKGYVVDLAAEALEQLGVALSAFSILCRMSVKMAARLLRFRGKSTRCPAPMQPSRWLTVVK